MPLGYGGGIKNLHQIKKLLNIGIEKIIINTAAFLDTTFIQNAVKEFGSSTIVVSVDVKKNLFGGHQCYIFSGKQNIKIDPVEFAKKMDGFGVGELLINSIDRDGTMTGYEVSFLKKITSSVSIPVIACGGAAEIAHFQDAVKNGGASAVAAGSMFVFHGKHKAVLISYPSIGELEKAFQ